jgi:hypothetical protein
LARAGAWSRRRIRLSTRVRIYALKPKPMLRLKIWLEQTEALWAAQLAAFKARLEREP